MRILFLYTVFDMETSRHKLLEPPLLEGVGHFHPHGRAQNAHHAPPEPRGATARGAGPESLLNDDRLWRASSLGRSLSPCLSSGFAALDAELPGGGWPTQALTEILQDEGSHGEWRLLSPALQRLWSPVRTASTERPHSRPPPSQGVRPLLLINPPYTPHLPGLQAIGLPPAQIVWVDTADLAHPKARAPAHRLSDALWATEQAIKAQAAGAVMAWLPHARPEQIRRLQALALHSTAPIFLLREAACAQQSSAAPLRVCLRNESTAASAQSRTPWATSPSRGPAKGPSHGVGARSAPPPAMLLGGLRLRLLKRRGPPLDGELQLNALPPGLLACLPERLRGPQGLRRPSEAPNKPPAHDALGASFQAPSQAPSLDVSRPF